MSWVYCEPKSRTMMVWWFRGSLSETKGKRYYNGVRRTRTTTSCSAVALTVWLGIAVLADAPTPEGRLFPLRGAWTLALESPLSAPPGFSETRGFFPLTGDRLAAYDVVTGTLQWVVPAQTDWPPVAGGGLIFLGPPGSLVALHEESGTIAWQAALDEALSTRVVWGAGWLVATTRSGRVLAFRAADGELLWQHDAGARVHAPPAFGGERVYISLENARVVALDLMNGNVEWERRLGGPANDALVLEDRVYVGSDDNFFYCLRTKDGEIEWRWRTGGDVIGTPIADADRVYFVSLDNVLRGLDRFNGAQRWKRPLTLRPTRGLVRAADTLLVSGAAPRAAAFNMKDGTPAGEVTAAGELAGPPHVIGAAAAGLPMVVVAGRDIAKGAIVSAMIRSVDPVMAPFSALPNPLPALAPQPDVPTR
jgi:outer membrane protein assembly factor BamB